jgi:glycosyltransferase involved in cell wall biosynthesis
MIKIAYIIDTFYNPTAGTEQQLLMLLNNLDRKRFAPCLICLRDSPWLKSQSFDFPVFIINYRKLLSLSFVNFIRQFSRLHKIEKFDIVQTFFPDANIAGVVASRLVGVPTILASRRNIGDSLAGFQLSILRFLKRYTTGYLANAKAVAEITSSLEGVEPEKIEVIYNGMYLNRFESISPELKARQRAQWGIEENELLIGLVGNLRPVKNIGFLIKAAAELCRVHSNLKFVVIGEGPDRGILQKEIDDLGLDSRFRLAGSFNDVIPCLAAFDIGVLCSKAEGFSNSVIEYMAAGLPVVASDVGGNAEAISHKENGMIYALDSPNGLIDSLAYLIENKEIAREYGRKARAAAMKKYAVSTYVINHEEFYLNMINKG